MTHDNASALEKIRTWRARTGGVVKDLAKELGMSHRTLEGVEQGRGFRYPKMLILAIETLLDKVSPAHDIRYFIGGDNSGHEYLVPCDMEKAWEAWCALPEDDPASWTEPHYAKRFGGILTFTDPKTE